MFVVVDIQYQLVSLPLGKGGGGLHLNKLESHSQNDALIVLSLVEIGPMILKKKILKFHKYNFTLLLLSPLEKGCGPSFKKT